KLRGLGAAIRERRGCEIARTYLAAVCVHGLRRQFSLGTWLLRRYHAPDRLVPNVFPTSTRWQMRLRIQEGGPMQTSHSLVRHRDPYAMDRGGRPAFATAIARKLLVVTALALGPLVAPVLGAASVSTVAETELLLTLRFTDSQGAQLTMDFSRANAADVW